MPYIKDFCHFLWYNRTVRKRGPMVVKDIHDLTKDELIEQFIMMRNMLDKQTSLSNRLRKENKDLQMNINDLELQLRIEKEKVKQLIAAKYQSQKNQIVLDMPTLFDDMEEESQKVADSEIEEVITIGEHKRIRRPKEKHIDYSSLPREEVTLNIPEEETICEVCESKMKVKKYETKEELVYEPAKLFVRVTKIPVLECENCQSVNEEGKSSYHTVKHSFLFPRSFCSPELLAYIIDMKYNNGLPLYALEKMFRQQNVEIPRQNMCNWVLGSIQYLEPLYNLMKKDLLSLPIIQVDETRTQVLKEDGKPATSTSYMWVYRSSKYEKPIVLYDYQPSRSGACAKEFLSGYSGWLGHDAYDGYNKVENVRHFLCHVHALRKFKDSYKLLPNTAEARKTSDEAKAIKKYDEIFHKSHQIDEKAIEKHKDFDQRMEYITKRRQAELKPMIEKFFAWLNEIKDRNAGRYSMSNAILYTLNHKEGLLACTEDGRLPLDNNSCERSIRPFVVIRNRCKFSVSTSGANASAMIYSIMITCIENNQNPYMYFTHLFENLPKEDLTNETSLRKYLPYSHELPDYTRTLSKQEIRAILKEPK